jgi:hypothetical protein
MLIAGPNLICSFITRDAKYPAKLGALENKANDMLDNIALATDTNIKSSPLIDQLDNSYIQLSECRKYVPLSLLLAEP